MPINHDVDCCDFLHAHEDLVAAVRQRMPDEDILYDLTELFRGRPWFGSPLCRPHR